MPETIISSSAVVLDEINYPAEVFLFHVNNEYDDDGDIAQPAGWKLPGGRYEKPRDETPRHAAQNETLLEIGIDIELRKFFEGSLFGEAILEKKTFENSGSNLYLEVYTFFMKRIGNTTVRKIETNEGGASGSFSLKDVLLMPLAYNEKTREFSPYGIQFSARKRIFTTLKRVGCNLLELIPDLPEFFDELDPDEVGEDVYWILLDALNTPESESVTLSQDEDKEALPVATQEHEKICPCDDCWQKWWNKEPISA